MSDENINTNANTDNTSNNTDDNIKSKIEFDSPRVQDIYDNLTKIKSSIENQLHLFEAERMLSLLAHLRKRYILTNKNIFNDDNNVLETSKIELLERTISDYTSYLETGAFRPITEDSLKSIFDFSDNAQFIASDIDIQSLEDPNNPTYSDNLYKLLDHLKRSLDVYKELADKTDKDSIALNKKIDDSVILDIFKTSDKYISLKENLKSIEKLLLVIENTKELPNTLYQIESILKVQNTKTTSNSNTTIQIKNLETNKTQILSVKDSPLRVKAVINNRLKLLILYQKVYGNFNLIGKHKEEIYNAIDTLLDKFPNIVQDEVSFKSILNYRNTEDYSVFRRKRVNDFVRKSPLDLIMELKTPDSKKVYIKIQPDESLPLYSQIHCPFFLSRKMKNQEEHIFIYYDESDFNISYTNFLNKTERISGSDTSINDLCTILITKSLENSSLTSNNADTIEISVNEENYNEAYINEYTFEEEAEPYYKVYTNEDIKEIVRDKSMYYSLVYNYFGRLELDFDFKAFDTMKPHHRKILMEKFKQHKGKINLVPPNTLTNIYTFDVDETKDNAVFSRHIEDVEKDEYNKIVLNTTKLTLPISPIGSEMEDFFSITTKGDLKTKSRSTLIQLLTNYVRQFEQDNQIEIPITPLTLELVFEEYKDEILKSYFNLYSITIKNVLNSIVKCVEKFAYTNIGHRIIQDIIQSGNVKLNEYSTNDKAEIKIPLTDLEEILNFFILKLKMSYRGKDKENNKNGSNLNLQVYKDLICLDDLWGFTATSYRSSKQIMKFNALTVENTYSNLIHFLYRLTKILDTFKVDTDVNLNLQGEAKMKFKPVLSRDTGKGLELIESITDEHWTTLGITKEEKEEYIKYIEFVSGSVTSKSGIANINSEFLAFIYLKALHKYYGERSNYRNLIFNNLVLTSISGQPKLVKSLNKEEMMEFIKSHLDKDINANTTTSQALEEIVDYAVIYNGLREIDLSHLIENLNKYDDINKELELAYIGYNTSDFTVDTIKSFNEYLRKNNLNELVHSISMFDTKTPEPAVKNSFIRDVMLMNRFISKNAFKRSLLSLNKTDLETAIDSTSDIIKAELGKLNDKTFNLLQSELELLKSRLLELDYMLLSTLCDELTKSLDNYFREDLEVNVILETLRQFITNSKPTLERITLKDTSDYEDISYKDISNISENLNNLKLTRILYSVIHKLYSTSKTEERLKEIQNLILGIESELDVSKIDTKQTLRNEKLLKLYLTTSNEKILDQIDFNQLKAKVLVSQDLFGEVKFSYSPYNSNYLISKYGLLDSQELDVKRFLDAQNLSFLTPIQFLSLIEYYNYTNDSQEVKFSNLMKIFPKSEFNDFKQLAENIETNATLFNVYKDYLETLNYSSNGNSFNISGLVRVLELLDELKEVNVKEYIQTLPLALRNELYNYMSSLDETKEIERILLNSELNIINI